MTAWAGIFHVMATPFTDGGALDRDGLPRLVECALETGIAGLTILYRWLPLIRYESQPGSAPGTAIGIRKEILRRRGWLASARVRPPAPALDEGVHAELAEILAAVGA